MAKEYLNRFNNTNFSPKYYVNSQNNNAQKNKKATENKNSERNYNSKRESPTENQNENLSCGQNLHTEKNSSTNIIDEIFKNSQLTSLLNLDADKLLIIAVIFVLYKEKTDVKLLLALLYVML